MAASSGKYLQNTLPGLKLTIIQGYLPLPTPNRAATLARKRGEYLSMVELTFARDREGLDQQIWHQIEIDVPRTRPGVSLWMHGATQRVHYIIPTVIAVWLIILPLEFRAYSICLGHQTSRQWICARY